MKRTLAALALFTLLSCGRPETPLEEPALSESTATAEQEILNGYDARSPLFDAIGALVIVQPDGTLVPFCTGTLVAPQVVLTAKHCRLVLSGAESLAFAIGPDARAPRRSFAIRSLVIEREAGGDAVMGLGSDTAVAILASPAVGLRPLEIKPTSRSDLNGLFLAVGYGRQFEPQTLDFSQPEAPAPSGTRMLAPLRVKGLGGDRYFEAVFGNFATFFHEFQVANPDLTPAELEAGARGRWDERIAEFELLAQSAIPRQQWGTSAGDSGGPLLAVTPTGFKVAGVVSGVAFEYYPGMPHPAYLYGTVYASMGVAARAFIQAARSCLEVTQQGVCSASGALERCIARNHGAAVQSTTCGAGTACVDSPRGASCAASCSSDGDCSALSPEGTCTAGRCSWSKVATCHAYRTQGETACAFCCSGVANSAEEFFACIEGCAPSSEAVTPATRARLRVRVPTAVQPRF